MRSARSWLQVLILTSFLILTPSVAAPSYLAGVERGDWAKYGSIFATWQSNIPGFAPPEPIAIFLGTDSVVNNITDVSGPMVTALQTLTFTNGTSRTETIQGNVADGQGSLVWWVLSAGLSPGDPIYEGVGAPPVNGTVTRVFAGAVREAVFSSSTFQFGPEGYSSFAGYWDRPTGILLSFYYEIVYNFGGQTASGRSETTIAETNLWSAGEPSFAIIDIPPFLIVDKPVAGTNVVVSDFTLVSLGNYSGQVSIRAVVLPSTVNGPTALIDIPDLFLSPGGSAASTLRISVSSDAPFGTYTVNVTATDSLQSHTVLLQLTVNPSDFTLGTDPHILYVRAGSSNSTLIIIFSNGGFSGTIQLRANVVSNATEPGLIGIDLDPANVTLAPNSFASSRLTVSAPFNSTGTSILRVTGTSGAISHEITVTVVTVPGGPPNLPPVAVISSPSTAFVGTPVSFSGLGSFDPDGFIQSYVWEFGDGFLGFGPLASHTYQNAGDYSVRLTVTDDLQATGTTTTTIHVQVRFVHDVAVVSVQVSPTTAVAGQLVNIFAVLQNQGTQGETVTLTVYANGHVLASRPNILLNSSDPFGGFVFLAGDTSNLSPGSYTVSATAFLVTDEDQSDNTLFDGTLTVLPPPTISVTPESGSLGTTVTVHGNGFPQAPSGFGTPPILVSFDDMFIGFSLAKNGSFEFVFSIPHAEPGSHQVKVLDAFSGIQVSTDFTVLESLDAQPVPRIDLSVTTGPIYFPGETAVIYVLTSINGLPQSQGLQVQATLYRPGGTTQTLSITSIGTGVYRAEYSIPRSGSLGVYSVVVVAAYGEASVSGMTAFEVKPTWLSSNAPRIASATVAIGGILAAVGIAWRKGYLRKDAVNETG